MKALWLCLTISFRGTAKQSANALEKSSLKLLIKLIDLLPFNIVGSCFLGIIRELFSMWHITIYTSSFFFLCSMRVNARNRSPESNYELTRQDSLPRSERET